MGMPVFKLWMCLPFCSSFCWFFKFIKNKNKTLCIGKSFLQQWKHIETIIIYLGLRSWKMKKKKYKVVMKFFSSSLWYFLDFFSFQSEVERNFAVHGGQCLEKARCQPVCGVVWSVCGVFSIDPELPYKASWSQVYRDKNLCHSV